VSGAAAAAIRHDDTGPLGWASGPRGSPVEASGLRAGEREAPATDDRTASSIGRIWESCLIRMTAFQAGSNFFQPAL
jgi:hypothetical protein